MTFEPSPPHDVDSLIASRLPEWLTAASLDDLSRLRTSLLQQQRIQHQLAARFARVAPLDTFGEALLGQALAARAWPRTDVRRAKLRHTRIVVPAQGAPGALGRRVEEVSEVTLLAAALQNFAEHETAPSGALHTSVIVDAQDEPLALQPAAFMQLCREVDVGDAYQRHLDEVIARPADMRQLLEEGARAALEASVRLALLSGGIDRATYYSLLPIISVAPIVGPNSGRAVPFDFRVLGKRVRGGVAFEIRHGLQSDAPLQGVVLWVPDDPHGALQRFDTWAALWQGLGRRFKAPDYAAFFARFISERDRPGFVQALDGLIRSAAGHGAIQLDGRSHRINAPLFRHLREVRVDTMLDDAALLAVPSAQAAKAEREQRMSEYANAGLNVLGLASLFVPALGLPLLGIAALQIADAVFEGYEDWQLGDREGALKHVWGVAENVAAGITLAGAGQVAARLIERSAQVDRLVPVLTAGEQVRLIDPSLPGYAVPDQDVAVGERTQVAGTTRVRTLQATYQVREEHGGFRIQHPRRSSAYSPWLDDNGEGGWRHQLETPRDWQDPHYLMQRLGSEWATLDRQTAERVMHIAGFDEDRLRELHLEHAPAPARLWDALQRYQLHERQPGLIGEAFEQHFAAMQAAPTPAAQLLRRDFPGLSARAAQEIVEHAGTQQIETLVNSGRVPLPLATQARWALRDSRLDRACVGFYQADAINPDSERLALGLIDHWSAWPDTLRIEIRLGGVAGELRARSAAQDATQVGYIIKRGQGYQAVDGHGTGLPSAQVDDSLFKALWLQLVDAQKHDLGEAGRSPESLSQALALRASDQRERAAHLLGMAPSALGVRPPVRLGDGRLGYPLSGGEIGWLPRGEAVNAGAAQARQSIRAGVWHLFPHRSAADIHWLIFQLARRPGQSIWVAFSELARQVDRLESSLRAWRGVYLDPAYRSRQQAGQLIREAWEPEFFGPHGVSELVVRNLPMGTWPELPADLAFKHIHRLSLVNVALKSLDDAFLSRFPNLRQLQLGGNKLVGVPRLDGMRHLNTLDLQFNKLTAIDGVGQLTGLAELIANDNELVALPGLGGLQRLTRLDLQRNRLADVEGLQQMTLLTRLDLSDNRLIRLPDSIHRLVRVQYLSLSGNRFESLPAGIEQMTGLLELDLSYNQLAELPKGLGELSRLRQLNVGDNRLIRVPGDLAKLSQLSVLDLRDNQLTAIPEGLERLRKLQELYLTGNQIVIDGPGAQRLEAFSALRTLHLGGNPIGTVPALRNLDHLSHLSLRATGLTELPLAFLERHPDLYVDLAENLIVDLSQQALQWIRNHPTRLNLFRNPLDVEAMARLQAVQLQLDTLSRQGRSHA